MDVISADIEVIDGSQLDEHEQMDFVETEAIQLEEGQTVIGSKIVDLRTEGELIKQLLDGKLSFSDYKVQVLDAENEGSDVDNEGSDMEYTLDDEDDQEEEEADLTQKTIINSAHFETELDAQRRNQLKGQFSKVPTNKLGRRKKSVLPAALQGLMGEANLRYARGDTETAEKVCLEIIRQVPLAVEPFHTLAQIYEGKDHDKCMQFMLIAGHLNPSDVDHWLRLAEMSEDMGNLKQASICLSKAVKASPFELDIRMRRIELTKRMGDDKTVLKQQMFMVG